MKFIVNGDVTSIPGGSQASGATVNFVDLNVVFYDLDYNPHQLDMEAFFDPDNIEIGKKYSGVMRDGSGNLILAKGKVSRIETRYGVVFFNVESTTSFNLPAIKTPPLDIDGTSLFLGGKLDGNLVQFYWNSIGNKAFFIRIAPDGEDSTFLNENVAIYDADAVIKPFSTDGECYVLWQHRDSEETEYKCYLGLYNFESSPADLDRYELTRIGDLIPLFTPESDLVTMEDVNAAIDTAIDVAITGAINASY